MTKPPEWEETLEDLDRRRQHAWAMGGPERLDKHRGKGKLDARARIARLLDPGTFRELGTLVGGEVAADAIVTGSEGRWLMFNETNQLTATTWLAGPRYHHTFGKFQVYGKGLVGMGQFTFPYNYAHGDYLVIAPGGGVDYRWKKKISFRLADVEYQIWPQFTYGSMTNAGISAGVLYHIF